MPWGARSASEGPRWRFGLRYCEIQTQPQENPRPGPLPPACACRHGTNAASAAAHSGAEVIDLDAGCCGMAGSFGYEKEHYEISRLVGEQRLFPAIRRMGPDDIIVAPGSLCRMQIHHFTVGQHYTRGTAEELAGGR